jgi:hypothetical protein
MTSALIAILISAGIGGAAYYITSKLNGPYKVSSREFLIGTLASTMVLLIAAPLTEKLILDEKTRYHEYFNGYEVAADQQTIPCERDGNCVYTYNCDPYLTTETYTTYDDEGDPHTHSRVVKKYHDCPYLKTEFKYTIVTTLGDFPIGDRFADSSKAGFRDEPIPASIPVGPPQQWLEVKARLAAGMPGGVTKVHDYKNFLLASDRTILDAYSADIETYLDKKLLPPHTTNYQNPIYGIYLADKFQLVKVPGDAKAWNESLMRLNGTLGKELQGDVHVAAVPADGVGDKDRYAQSLFAYWKSDAFGKDAFPKNAVGVVVGVKDGSIAWARATGGLPVGNEGLFTDIRNNLVGVKFEPAALIGVPHKAEGALTKTLWGQNKYKRPCMECVEEKVDGYQYLKSDIYITGWQRFWIVFIGSLLSAGMWAIFLYADDSYRASRRYY